MIELIRSEHCSECDAVQAQLDEMTVAHTVTTVGGAPDDVPMIKDGDKVIPREEIKRYLAELGEFVDEWSHFQSDVCYVDSAGKIC
jgi:hypothetical protein